MCNKTNGTPISFLFLINMEDARKQKWERDAQGPGTIQLIEIESIWKMLESRREMHRGQVLFNN